MKIVLATRNRDKAREIVGLLAGLDVEVRTLEDFPPCPATREDGQTLEANAVKKAREARDHTGLSALADDTGLEVDALGGAPGIYSSRFAREGAAYAENCAKLRREMAGVPLPERGARFRTVMALALSPADAARLAPHPDGGAAAAGGATDCIVTEGILTGSIAETPRGSDGFGYDPLFVERESGRTLAEMTLAEKNRTSHRYRALVEMRETLLRCGLVTSASV